MYLHYYLLTEHRLVLDGKGESWLCATDAGRYGQLVSLVQTPDQDSMKYGLQSCLEYLDWVYGG